MPWFLRALAAAILLVDAATVGFVALQSSRQAPGWVAMHYAPVPAASQCEATVSRLHAAMRRQGHEEPTADEAAALDRLRASGDCGPGSAAVQAIEAAITARP